ncbi:hypothetical protein [Alteromonas sp. CYL-A6]|uniref:hypothetical protein n=1 Tax=Alteromonas nitratireducens TaxID=3390813 RepID=UPI0034AD94C0
MSLISTLSGWLLVILSLAMYIFGYLDSHVVRLEEVRGTLLIAIVLMLLGALLKPVEQFYTAATAKKQKSRTPPAPPV